MIGNLWEAFGQIIGDLAPLASKLTVALDKEGFQALKQKYGVEVGRGPSRQPLT